MDIKTFHKNNHLKIWLADILALIGGSAYFIQSWIYAHTQESILDEGAYLLKGYLFATGKYRPFQDYGPLTNHMPLSFLIPGWIQVLFQPGLRTGRYFAVILGVLMLAGIWIVSCRLGNEWWAALLIWLIVLNEPLIRTYSIFASQVLVACILVWILVLIAGPNRKTWQIIAGTSLASILALTRLNLIPVLPFVVIYVYWEHGRRTGLKTLLSSLFILILGHAVFWPGILKLWAYWLPDTVTPFLDQFRPPPEAVPSWNPSLGLWSRVLSFFQGIQNHFFAVTVVFLTWILWPSRKRWKSDWRYRLSVFLSVLFGVLFLLHIWATLFLNYCVFCFQAYLSFFMILGLLLFVVSFSSWIREIKGWRKLLTIGLIVIVFLGLGYAASIVPGNRLLSNRSVRWLFSWPVPRFNNMRVQPGRIAFWQLLANKYDLTEQLTALILRRFLFIFVASLIVGFIFWIGHKSTVLLFPSHPRSKRSSGFGTVMVFLSVGSLLTSLIGTMNQGLACGWNVIETYEIGGRYLAEHIPAGSQIYWSGGLSAVPLLYLDDYELYPSQLNMTYSYRLGGQPDELVRYGWWSKELAQQWAQEADVILIEARLYGTFPTNIAESEAFDEIAPTPPMVPCRSNSSIHIFIREH